MPDCKGCGNWFGSATKCDLCPICERALERLNGYAVPVVRCKDCKWWSEYFGNGDPGKGWCDIEDGGTTHAMYYCACGERKEDNDETD